jgi:CheY-like chemotaxis protein
MSNALAKQPITTVLVVDDDDFSQALFRGMLEQLGISDIHSAANGIEGLRELRSMARPPDVLICDVFMPDMDGIEFLGQLKKIQFAGGIMLVSGMNIEMMAIAQEMALADGLAVLGAYTKPVPLTVLAQAMALFTERSSSLYAIK